MGVSYRSDIDLESGNFCDFLGGPSVEGFMSALDDPDITSDGFQFPPDLDFPLPSGLIPNQNIETPLRFNSVWDLRSTNTGALINRFETYSVELFAIDIETRCRGFFAATCTQAQRDAIGAMINNLDPAQLAVAGEAYVAQLEADLTAQGIGPDLYLIDLGILAKKVGQRTGLDTFLSLESSINQIYGTSAALQQKSRDYTCDKSGFEFSDGVIQVPAESLEKPGIVEQELDKAMEEAAQALDCAPHNLTYIHHRVGTLFQYPEFKTETEKKWVRIGKCKLFKLKVITKVYKRTTKRALYVSAASPKSIVNAIEKALVDCMIESAIAVGILALITGGMSLAAAASAYYSAVTFCVKEKLGDLHSCIFHKAYLVTEPGEWKQV